ncbi:terminase family protein [bacterium]|nr:terminase family protein [bacterium]
MQLTKPQSEIFCSNSRFRVCVAGRRFGKTFLSTGELLKAAIGGKNRNCWYLAPTYQAAKEIAWSMLIDTIPEEYIVKTNETALTLKLINGSIISLKGAEKAQNLRGRSLDFCVLDEFSDMRPEAWYEVIRPSLSDRQGSALFIGTPKGRNHFYDLWASGLNKENDWQSFQYTTLEGGNVPKSEVEAAKIDLDERTFNQEYCAEFVTYSGLIYYAFSRELSVADCSDEGTLHIGMDFNLDPMSAVISVRRGEMLYAVDEIVMYGSNTDEMVTEIKDRYPNRYIIVYPDPASRQRKTSAGGRTDLSILQNAGFAVKAKKSHALVRDRINAVNSRLLSSNGERKLFVSPKCKQTIKSLERQTYKEGTSIPNKDGFDHMNDALGYLVEYLFPVRTEYNTPQPTRWT